MATPDMWVNVDPSLDFWDPRPKQLLAYWQAKCGARRMPRRADVDPLELKAHIGNLVLIEVEFPLRLRYRLIGTNITMAMERDSTGKYYDEIYPPDLLASIYASFRWMLKNRAPLRTYGRAFYPDKNFYDYETLNLPLSEDDDVVSMVLGELVFHGSRANDAIAENDG